MENDAPDAFCATTEIVEGQEHEALRQTLQIARQLEVETEINQSANLGVLKATSGNATKRLKIRQETRVTTRAGKSAEAAIKQITTQDLQAKKEKMKKWEQIVSHDVARELQLIRQASEEAIERKWKGNFNRLNRDW